MHNLSGNTRSQSPLFAEPLWTDPGLQSGISVHKLIFTLKKKSAGREGIVILPKSSHARKKPPPPLTIFHLPHHMECGSAENMSAGNLLVQNLLLQIRLTWRVGFDFCGTADHQAKFRI